MQVFVVTRVDDDGQHLDCVFTDGTKAEEYCRNRNYFNDSFSPDNKYLYTLLESDSKSYELPTYAYVESVFTDNGFSSTKVSDSPLSIKPLNVNSYINYRDEVVITSVINMTVEIKKGESLESLTKRCKVLSKKMFDKYVKEGKIPSKYK